MTAAYVHRHVVSFDETNLVGNVYFAHYARWQGHCREAFLAERAPRVLAALRAGELALVTASMSVEYYAECYAADAVELHMTLHSVSPHRLEMAFDYRRGGTTVATGRQVVACLRPGGGEMVPAPIPDGLLDALTPFR